MTYFPLIRLSVIIKKTVIVTFKISNNCFKICKKRTFCLLFIMFLREFLLFLQKFVKADKTNN